MKRHITFTTIMLVLLTLPGALATCGNLTSTLTTIYTPYQAINETYTIKAYYTNTTHPLNETNTSVTINDGTTTLNMSYNEAGYYAATVSDNTSEDINFTINATDDNHECHTDTFTIKFREPFTVTIKLYEANGTSTKNYDNDFTYVYMGFTNTTYDSYSLGGGYYMGYLNELGRLVPYYNDVEFAGANDPALYFWSHYENGAGSIILYETGNYTVYALAVNKLDAYEYSEFKKPLRNYYDAADDIKLTNVEINNATATTVSIHFNKWDVAKMSVIRDTFYTGLIITLWIFLCIGIFMIAPYAGIIFFITTIPFIAKLGGLL